MRRVPRPLKAALAGLALVACSRPAVVAREGSPAERAPRATETALVDSTDDLTAVLAAHVDEAGLVDYAALRAGPGALDACVRRLAAVPAGELATWSDRERIAFWINAYNALTLRLIVDHYPIRSRVLASLIFPKNSIRQIPGAWDEIEWRVAGRSVTLDDIEHRILRERFQEPRIHFALVCAARSCPPLRAEPYRAEDLDVQLEDQVRRFLSRRDSFRLDPHEPVVELSAILDWFADDFVTSGGGEPERAVLDFLAERTSGEQASRLRDPRLKVGYLDYDWTLNEQPPKESNRD